VHRQERLDGVDGSLPGASFAGAREKREFLLTGAGIPAREVPYLRGRSERTTYGPFVARARLLYTDNERDALDVARITGAAFATTTQQVVRAGTGVEVSSWMTDATA
jgi:hypothetical protein